MEVTTITTYKKVMENQYIINNVGDIKQGSHRAEVVEVKTCDSCSFGGACHKEVRINTKKNNAGYLCHKIVKITTCSAWEAQ